MSWHDQESWCLWLFRCMCLIARWVGFEPTSLCLEHWIYISLLSKSRSGFWFFNSPIELPPDIEGTSLLESSIFCVSDRRTCRSNHVPVFGRLSGLLTPTGLEPVFPHWECGYLPVSRWSVMRTPVRIGESEFPVPLPREIDQTHFMTLGFSDSNRI